jgi:hypothetical protein
MKNSNYTIGKGTRDLPACGAVAELCHRVPLHQQYSSINEAEAVICLPVKKKKEFKSFIFVFTNAGFFTPSNQ